MTCQIDSVSATHLFDRYQLTRFFPRQLFGQLEGNKPAELYLLSFVDDLIPPRSFSKVRLIPGGAAERRIVGY